MNYQEKELERKKQIFAEIEALGKESDKWSEISKNWRVWNWVAVGGMWAGIFYHPLWLASLLVWLVTTGYGFAYVHWRWGKVVKKMGELLESLKSTTPGEVVDEDIFKSR